MNISEMIKQKRSEMGLSFRQLSEKTGVSHTYIRDVENGKYAASFDNAIKIAQVLDLELQNVIVETYQSQLRGILFELIETCHKCQVRIPFDEWVKSNLPLQPLGTESNQIHDTASEIARHLYQEQNQRRANKKLELIKTVVDSNYDPSVYPLVPDLLNSLDIAVKFMGFPNVKAEVENFIQHLNEKYEVTIRKGDTESEE